MTHITPSKLNHEQRLIWEEGFKAGQIECQERINSLANLATEHIQKAAKKEFGESKSWETMKAIAKSKGWRKPMCACGFPQSKAPYHEHSLEREIWEEGFKAGIEQRQKKT